MRINHFLEQNVYKSCLHGNGPLLHYSANVREVMGDIVPRLYKDPLECVPSPLESVLDGIGKILQSADGNGLLRWVLR